MPSVRRLLDSVDISGPLLTPGDLSSGFQSQSSWLDVEVSGRSRYRSSKHRYTDNLRPCSGGGCEETKEENAIGGAPVISPLAEGEVEEDREFTFLNVHTLHHPFQGIGGVQGYMSTVCLRKGAPIDLD